MTIRTHCCVSMTGIYLTGAESTPVTLRCKKREGRGSNLHNLARHGSLIFSGDRFSWKFCSAELSKRIDIVPLVSRRFCCHGELTHGVLVDSILYMSFKRETKAQPAGNERAKRKKKKERKKRGLLYQVERERYLAVGRWVRLVGRLVGTSLGILSTNNFGRDICFVFRDGRDGR